MKKSYVTRNQDELMPFRDKVLLVVFFTISFGSCWLDKTNRTKLTEEDLVQYTVTAKAPAKELKGRNNPYAFHIEANEMEGKYILGFEINYARKSDEIRKIKTNDELELVIAAIDTTYVNVTSNQVTLYGLYVNGKEIFNLEDFKKAQIKRDRRVTSMFGIFVFGAIIFLVPIQRKGILWLLLGITVVVFLIFTEKNVL